MRGIGANPREAVCPGCPDFAIYPRPVASDAQGDKLELPCVSGKLSGQAVSERGCEKNL
jgi:hypothetical protein